MTSFRDARTWLARRQRAARLAAEDELRLPQRLDLLLAALATGLLAVLVLLGLGVGWLQSAYGPFDGPVPAPVQDERLTANLRSAPSRVFGSFVAADVLPDENALYLLRAKGLLHRLDLQTGLWSETSGLTALPDVPGPFIDLSPACPVAGPARAACPGGAELFAYSAGGGLAMRRNGAWTVVIAETSFRGLSGKPVTNAQLTSAAVSSDGRWLMLAAGKEGLALFDLSQRRWIAVPPSVQRSIFAAAVDAPTALVAYGRAFLVGTRTGLVALQVGSDGALTDIVRVPKPDGEVLDIVVGFDEALVLARHGCPDGPCLLLGRYAGGAVTSLLEETELFPALASTSVSRALVSTDGRTIFVLGEAGVYAYARDARTWRRLLPDRATAFLEGPAIEGIYFGTPGQANHLSRSGRLQNWTIPGGVLSFATDGKGRVLAQTPDNATYALDAAPKRLVAGTQATEELDELDRAVAAFGQVVATSSKSLLLHDPAARTYQSQLIADFARPGQLGPSSMLVGTPDYLWSVNGTEMTAFRAEPDGTSSGVQAAATGSLPEAPRVLHALDSRLIGATGSGVPFIASVAGSDVAAYSIVGSPLAGGSRIIDALLADGRAYLGRSDRVDIYSEFDRGTEPSIPFEIGEDLAEMAMVDRQLLLLGEGGSVVPAGTRNRITGSATPVISSSAAISDAMPIGVDAMLIAGPGGVTRYSSSQRRVSDRYATGSGPRTRLAGAIDNVPVSYDGTNAWYGEASLSLDGAMIAAASVVGSRIYTTQRRGGVTFLVAHEAGGGSLGRPVCSFGAPGPADARPLDMGQLADGRSVALVDNQLWLRDEAHRRYVAFTVATDPVPPSARLTVAPDHVLVWWPGRALIVPTQTLFAPDSCDIGPVDIRNRVTRLAAPQLAIAGGSAAVWMLDDAGEVSVWRDGETSTVLAAATAGPIGSELTSADRGDQSLYFTDAGGVWAYDTVRRQWRYAAIAAGDDPLVRVDVWNNGSDMLLTARDAAGVHWGGTVGAGHTTTLARLGQADFQALPFSPDALLDVAMLPDRTAVFLGRGDVGLVAGLDTDQPGFRHLPLPSSRDDRRLAVQSGRLLVLDGDAAAPATVHVLLSAAAGDPPGRMSFSPGPGEKFEVRRDGGVLRQLPDGQVFACPPVAGSIDLAACAEQAPPALRLDAASVAKAFPLDRDGRRLIVADPGGGVSEIDRAARSRRPLFAAAGPIARAFSFRDAALLLSAARELWLAPGDGSPSRQLGRDLRILRVEGQLLLLQTGEGALGLAADATALSDAELFAALGGEVADDASLEALSLVADGAAAILRSPSGLALVSLGGRAPVYDDLLSLPGGEALAEDPLQVVRSGDDWALRYPDRLLLVGRGQCEIAPPEQGAVSAPSDIDAPSITYPQAPDEAAVTAAPELAAGPIDCLLVRASYALPAGRNLNIQSVIDGAVTADGRPMRADGCSDQPFDFGADTGLVRPPTPRCTLSFAGDDDVVVQVGLRDIADDSVAFAARIDAASGQLDPTTISDQGGQMALRVGDIVIDRFDGSVSRQQPAPFDIGWMGWERSARQFQFTNDAGSRFNVPPAQALPNGRFAFASPGTAVMISASEYLVTNPFGVWRYSRGTRGPRSWLPLALPQAGVPARGRVVFENGLSIGLGDAAATAQDIAVQLQQGQLTISADTVAQRVAATWSDAGSNRYDAFAAEGFQFDRRLDIALEAGRSWLLTPVGMVDTADLSRAAPLPAGIAAIRSDGDVLSIRGQALATDGSSWQQLSGGAWSAAVDPDLDRVVAVEGPLEWRYDNGVLEVAAAGRPDLARRSGLRFDADVLAHAAVASDGVVLMLGDGMVRTTIDPQGMAEPPPPLSSPPPSLAQLDVRAMADGRRRIVALGGGGAIDALWDGSAFGAPLPGDNPDIARMAAELAWLRVRFERDEPVTELLLEQPGGGTHWSPIAWAAGSPMPFDRLTAVHGVGDVLAAGSSVGLQLLTLSGSTIRSQRFIDLRAGAAGPYDPVRRIGTALAPGGGVAVLGEKNCLELTPNAISRCADPDPLDIEDLGGDRLWQWLRRDGTISYSYLDSAGQPLTGLLSAPTSGRFPHDSVDDIIGCGGELLQVWSGAITRLDSRGGMLNALTVGVAPDAALTLHCQGAAAPPSSDDPQGLPAGAYLLGNGQAWQWNGKGITARVDLLGALQRRANGQVAFERGKLRVINQRGVLFQYRRGDQWEDLASDGQRLAIDRRDHLVFADGAFFAHTPQGFVSLDARTGGLDPDKVIIAPLAADPVGCVLDAAETADGRLSYLPTLASGPAVIVRCSDGQLLTGVLDPSSEGRTFKPLAGTDPFERRAIFDDKMAGIEMIGRRPGTAGSLSFTWRGEDNALSGGRFASDDLRALARIEADTLDLVTGLGWLRQMRDRPGDAGAFRPLNRSVEARTVTAISADADPDNLAGRPTTPRLCLTSAGTGTSASWLANGRFDPSGSCAELLAFDGSHAYRRADAAGLSITGASANGPMLVRELTEGRFSDHRFTGTAAVAELDGEPTIAVATGSQLSLFTLATGRQRPGWAWPAADALALSRDGSGEIIVMSARGLLRLDGRADDSCPGFARHAEGVAAGGGMRGLTLAGDHAYLRVRDPAGMVDVRIDCGPPEHWMLGDFVDASQRQRFLVNLEQWGRPPPLLSVEPSRGRLTAHMANKSLVLREGLSAVSYARRVGQTFFFVTSDEIYGLDLDTLLSAVQSRGAAP